jgi:hypothetical protein
MNAAHQVVLEGMGRAIETNLYSQFKVDVLKVGMVKHYEVIARSSHYDDDDDDEYHFYYLSCLCWSTELVYATKSLTGALWPLCVSLSVV